MEVNYQPSSLLFEILNNLSQYLDKTTHFNGLDFYYDEDDIDANSELPLICYNVGYADDNSELYSIPHECLTIYRKVGIGVYTDNMTPGELEDELYTAEEKLLEAIKNVLPVDIHRQLERIKYVGTNSIRTLEYHNLDQNDKTRFFVNRLVVNVELQYTLF